MNDLKEILVQHENDFVDFDDVVSAGDSYEITVQSVSIFGKMENFYVSMYRDTVFPFDLEHSFVENSLVETVGTINDSPGDYGIALFYVYFDTNWVKGGFDHLKAGHSTFGYLKKVDEIGEYHEE